MNNKRQFLALAMSIFTTYIVSAEAYGSVRCGDIFTLFNKQALASFEAVKLSSKTSALFLKSADQELNSTTGNRVERKFTGTVEEISEALENLQNKLGSLLPTGHLESRDAQTPGFQNVTITTYLTKLKLKIKGGDLVAKIRMRKYGLVDVNSAIEVANFVPIAQLADAQGRKFGWLEFKIEHPDYENAVLKPRIKFYDSFFELLNTPQIFLQNLEPMIKETQILNHEVDSAPESKSANMLRAIAAVLKEGVDLKPISETLYQRTSYVINLKNKKTDEAVDVQLTVDRDIHQYSTLLAEEVASYGPALVVIEVKIPVAYSKIDEEREAAVPGLKQIKKFIKKLSLLQHSEYEQDKGKFSRAVKVLSADN